MYLDFFAAHGVPTLALAQLRRFAGRNLGETMAGVLALAGAFVREFRQLFARWRP
jgi:hypothetical protein